MKICLCGSTRFSVEYRKWNADLTKAGHVVYSMALAEHASDPLTEGEKETIDLVHLGKILESDMIFVITVPWKDIKSLPYVGNSTRREIKWAKILGKPVYTDCDDSRVIETLIDVPTKILAELDGVRP